MNTILQWEEAVHFVPVHELEPLARDGPLYWTRHRSEERVSKQALADKVQQIGVVVAENVRGLKLREPVKQGQVVDDDLA